MGGLEHDQSRGGVAPLSAVLGRAVGALASPVPALPLDVLRVLFGLIGLVYFWETLGSSAAFSNTNGFIDHEIVREGLLHV